MWCSVVRMTSGLRAVMRSKVGATRKIRMETMKLKMAVMKAKKMRVTREKGRMEQWSRREM